MSVPDTDEVGMLKALARLFSEAEEQGGQSAFELLWVCRSGQVADGGELFEIRGWGVILIDDDAFNAQADALIVCALRLKEASAVRMSGGAAHRALDFEAQIGIIDRPDFGAFSFFDFDGCHSAVGQSALGVDNDDAEGAEGDFFSAFARSENSAQAERDSERVLFGDCRLVIEFNARLAQVAISHKRFHRLIVPDGVSHTSTLS